MILFEEEEIPAALTPEERVQDDLDFYFKYHHHINDYYVITKCFFLPNTEPERSVAKEDPFFETVAYASWALVIVDLCKIFQKSWTQKHNLLTLLDDIKNKPAYLTIRQKIGDALLLDYINKIAGKQSVISKINILRNTHYAHTDDLRIDLNKLVNPTYLEIEEMLNLLKDTVITIGSKVFDGHYEFPETHESCYVDPEAIIRDVAKQRTAPIVALPL